MKVPVLNQARIQQAGLPSVGQSNPSRGARDFLNPVAATALDGVGQVADNAQRIGMQLLAQEAQEAKQYRQLDGMNQFEQYAQDREYGEQGWRRITGGDVFSQQSGGKPLTDTVVDDLKARREEIATSMGDEIEQAKFRIATDRLINQQRGALVHHESDQYRVYKRGVLSSGIENEIKSLSLTYNDPDKMQAALSRIDLYGAELGKLEGVGEEAGRMMGQEKASEAIKQAIAGALQHSDHAAAQNIIAQFGGHLEANDKTTVEAAVSDSWAAELMQNYPEELLRVLGDQSNSGQATGGQFPALGEKEQSQLAPYQADIEAQAAAYGVDPEFMRRQILAESSGNPNAKSKVAPSSGQRSIGLTQFQPATAKRYGIDPTDPKQAIQGQARYMRDLLDRFGGDYQKAAAGYNWGEGNVEKAIAKYGDNWLDHAPTETRNYVAKLAPQNAKGGDSVIVSNDVKSPVITGTPADMMNAMDRRKWINAAKSQLEHGRSVFAADLKNKVQDQYAQTAATGKRGAIIPPEDFQRAFGENWQDHYGDYTDKVAFAGHVFSLNGMPAATALQSIEAEKPMLDSPNFAREQHQYEQMQQAYAHIDKSRKADPIAWAQQNGYPIHPINWNNIQQAGAELRGRAAMAQQLTDNYGTGFAVLSKSELDGVTQAISNGTEDEQIMLFKGIADGLNDPHAYAATMQQVRPDSPATQLAGALIGMDRVHVDNGFFSDTKTPISGETVARTILRGERLLNPAKGDKASDGKGAGVKLPTGINETLYGIIGDALGGDADAEQGVVSAVRAYYAAKMDKSDTVLNEELLTEAVQNVTGGMAEHAGKKVIMPFGMDETAFLDRAHQQFTEQAGSMASLIPFNALPMVPVGGNRYGLQRGDRLLSIQGKPVILDFN